jgi:hypothetical protein
MKERLALPSIILFAFFVFGGCSNPSGSSSTVSITGVSINTTGFNLELGSEPTYQLTATVAPTNASQVVTWSSDNTTIVSVLSSGLVTGVSLGTALITATASDNKTTATVGAAVWGNDGSGFLRYLNNDTYMYGWEFWHEPPATGNTSSLTATLASPFTIQVKKVTGAADAGFGLMFYEQDSSNLYRFIIATNGKYQLEKRVSGTWSTLVGWTTSSAIAQGNQVNTLSVWQPSAGQISVSINGMIVISAFSDVTFSAGKIGLYVYSGYPTDAYPESFPGTPEDIRFKVTSPFSYP